MNYKIGYTFIFGFALGAFIITFYVRFDLQPIKRSDVMLKESFMIDNKEWECRYTPKQVEINMLEEQIEKIRTK